MNPWLRLCFLLIAMSLLGWVILAKHVSLPTFVTGPRAPRPDFVWGASIIPYPTGPHVPATLTEVMNRAMLLGLRVVRTEIPPGLKTNDEKFAYLDPIVDAAQKANINLDLIIHSKWAGEDDDVFSQPNLEQLARDRATAVAKRYQGRVRYYQLGNEFPVVSLKPSWSGSTPDAYDDAKYAASITWLNASTKAIRAADPKAKIIVTANWLQYGFFERAFHDKIDIDIIGWDWFDETHDVHNLEESGQPVDLIQRLAAFKKPIWFVEAGYSASTHSQTEQADLDAAFLKDVSSNPVVKGALVGVLIDSVNVLGTKGEHDGIIALDYANPGLPTIGLPKPAFTRIQQLITEVSGPRQ